MKWAYVLAICGGDDLGGGPGGRDASGSGGGGCGGGVPQAADSQQFPRGRQHGLVIDELVGAAEAGTGYHSITGAWSVPAVSATKSASYSSNWIGIDGYNNSNLIQTGTESDYYNGSAHYAVWWEILPAAETPITAMTVKPGDKMTASIVKGARTSWTITINDTTSGQSYTTVQNYTGPTAPPVPAS